MSSSLAPLNQGMRWETRAARASTPSVASMTIAAASQKNASRKRYSKMARVARNASTALLAV